MSLESLFPKEVITATSRPGLFPGQIFPEEWTLVDTAVDKRKAEFCGGRVCARRALEKLGFVKSPILSNPDRTPVWPEGVTGSLSHTDDYCCAAVARSCAAAGIGLDVEMATPLDENLISLVCTPGEERWLKSSPSSIQGLHAKLIFCIKEAAYKCQYPMTGLVFEFHEAEAVLDMEDQTFSVQFAERSAEAFDGMQITGRFAIKQKHLLAGAFAPQKQSSPVPGTPSAFG